MNLRLCETSRGKGKIFTRFELQGAPDGSRVTASATDEEGHPLPARVIDVAGVEGSVLALTVLEVPQRVTFRVTSPGGDELGSYQRTVSAFMAKLRSRYNTATKNQVAESIRNCDNKLRPQGIVTDVTDVLLDALAGQDVVHGYVQIVSTSREEAGAKVELRVLDPHGRDAARSEFVALGDLLRPSNSYPDTFVREISFSVRVDHLLPSLTVWASCPDTQMDDGFTNVEDFRLAGIRNAWMDYTTSADRTPNYEEWFEAHRASERDLDIQRLAHFELRPSFSFVVPLFHTPLDFFDQMVDSVLAQSYPDFELLLVNASPEDEALAAAVEARASSDRRVRCIALEENRGITENTNEGIKAATGDFLCFLDHDDLIEPDLLYHYARGINAHPETDLLYCDEDKLAGGHYSSPFFKPDWSPDLLCSCNYVCHLLTVRRSVVDQLELPGKEYDGAQDQHMTLRVGELARNVYHARRVLYHWRVHESSTAAAAGAKSYTSEAGVRVVQGHLDRRGIPARAFMDPELPNMYRLSYHIKSEPLVSIVIPNKDMVDMLDRCLESVYGRTDYENFEVIVVENNSTDAATFSYYVEAQRRFPRLRVVEQPRTDGSFNFSKTVNYGVGQSAGELVLLLNNDIEVISPGWLTSLVGPCLREDVGITGAKLLYPDGLIQHAGVAFHRGGPVHVGRLCPSMSRDYYNLLNLTQNLSAVTGACLLTKRPLFDELGGLDEEAFAVDYNDIDYCARVRARGLLVTYVPEAVLYHYESVSRGSSKTGEAALRFCRENGRMMERWPRYFVEGDPYMSPSFRPAAQYRGLA